MGYDNSLAHRTTWLRSDLQAGSEVSALLGRMSSAVGYQPTLSYEMGQLQERITSSKNGSITSIQAVYVPADDLTDPAPAATFSHLDARTVLDRKLKKLFNVNFANVQPHSRSSAKSHAFAALTENRRNY